MAVKLVRIASAAALLVGVAACGQKGPLYLPDKGGEVVTRPGGGQTQSPSTETAPQPSTQPQTNTTESEKKPNPKS